MSAERAAAAAVKVRGKVLTGRSHKEAVFAAAFALAVSPVTVWAEVGRDGQGFTTTSDRFVSRAEAYVIAERAGQLRWKQQRGQAGRPELHSEELR